MTQATTLVLPTAGPRQKTRRGELRIILRSKLVRIGLLICIPMAIVAIVGPSLAPYDPLAIAVKERLSPPSLQHWMGTDNLGRDIFSRVIYGARVSFEVGIASLVLGLVAGVALGALSGFIGGKPDSTLMRLMDAIMAFPAILLALVLVAIMGRGLVPVMIAITIIRIPVFARTVRSLVLSEREREYIVAARTLGQDEWAILARHIIPNILSPIIVLATSYFASAIVVEASLSFLGLGVIPPDVSWGTMLSESRQYMERCPWAPFFPGLAISAAVLGFNLLGDGLRDVLDPRLRSTL